MLLFFYFIEFVNRKNSKKKAHILLFLSKSGALTFQERRSCKP